MLELAIFDMDGVLVDSEVYWKKYEKELYPKIGIEFTTEVHADVMGLTMKDIAVVLKKKYNPDITEKSVRVLYDEIAARVYTDARPLPGVVALLQSLQQAGIPAVIGSSATAAMIDLSIDGSGIRNYFTEVYSVDGRGIPGKPDPAIYTYIMKTMNIAREKTIIFEDSWHGFRAAVASGARVVAVTDPRWCDLSHDYSDADLHLESLAGVSLNTLQSVVT